MALRVSAENQAYTGSLGLGSQANFTLCLWANISVDQNAFSSAITLDGGATTDSVGFQTTTDGVQQRIVYDDSNATNLAIMTVGTWYFMAVSVSGTTGTAYMKTASAATLTATTANPTTSGFTLNNIRMSTFTDAGQWMNGRIAHVKLWTAALTATEMFVEANNGRPFRYANLVGWWPLHNLGDFTVDYSGNGRSLTAGAGAATTEDGPGVPWSSGLLPQIFTTSDPLDATPSVSTIAGTTTISGTAQNNPVVSTILGTTTISGSPPVTALVAWNAEGGTNTTGITTGNSGGASGDAFDSVSLGTGATATYDNTQARQTLAAKLATSGTAADCSLNYSTKIGTKSQVWFRAYVYMAANPASNHRLMDAWDSGAGQLCFALYLSSTGKLISANTLGSQIQAMTTSIPLNQWFRIELMAIGSATVGQVEVKLFSTADSTTPTESITSPATQNTRGTFNNYRFGASGDPMPASRTIWLDNLGIGVSGYLGPATTDASTTPSTIAGTTTMSGTAQAGTAPAPATIVGAAALSGAASASQTVSATTITGATVITATVQAGATPSPATIAGTAVLSGSPPVSAAPATIAGTATLSGSAQAGARSAPSTIFGVTAISGAASASATAVPSTIVGATTITGAAQVSRTVTAATIAGIAVLSGTAQAGARPSPSTINATTGMSGTAQAGAVPGAATIAVTSTITGAASAASTPVPATIAPTAVVLSGTAQTAASSNAAPAAILGAAVLTGAAAAGANPAPSTIATVASLSGTAAAGAGVAAATIAPTPVALSGSGRAGATASPATLAATVTLSGTASTANLPTPATIAPPTVVLSGTASASARPVPATIAPPAAILSGSAFTPARPAAITGTIVISGTATASSRAVVATVAGIAVLPGPTVTSPALIVVVAVTGTTTMTVAASASALAAAATVAGHVVLSGVFVSEVVPFVDFDAGRVVASSGDQGRQSRSTADMGGLKVRTPVGAGRTSARAAE